MVRPKDPSEVRIVHDAKSQDLPETSIVYHAEPQDEPEIRTGQSSNSVWRKRGSGPKYGWERYIEPGRIVYGSGIVRPCVEARIEALQDGDANERARAAADLGKLGPRAKDAVAALIESLDDEYDLVYIFAAEALKMIDPEAAFEQGLE